MTGHPLPTFLIIGAQKSATRWLRYNLGLHPEVFAAPEELRFFSNGERFATMGVDGYRERFHDWQGEPVIGEATPAYMMWRHHPDLVAERIAGVVPDVRLLAILRNPVDRAQSAVTHHIKHGRLETGTDLLGAIAARPPDRDKLGIINGGWYGASLRPFRDAFGEQLLVLVHDDLGSDTAAVYDRARAHIGAREEFRPADLAERRFSNVGPASEPTISPRDRALVWEYFADDVAELERMFSIDLSRWRPQDSLAAE